MSELIELTKFKMVESINDIKSFNKEFKVIDMEWLKEYIEENKGVIYSVDVGIAEDVSCMITIWKKPTGYIKKNIEEMIVSSAWGTPGVSVQFYNDDILNFSCVKKKEEIKKRSFFNIFFKFLFKIFKVSNL